MILVKLCKDCGETKPVGCFYRHPKGHRFANCKPCCSQRSKQYKRAQRRRDPVTAMLYRARARAVRKGIVCTITEADISIPTYCPVLGLPLEGREGRLHDNSPSLDRINPDLGYVPGNVRVISQRANHLKSNASVRELELVLADLRKLRVVRAA